MQRGICANAPHLGSCFLAPCLGYIQVPFLSRSRCCCRQNQELEQDTLEVEEEKAQLQKETERLTQRLDAIMKDKFSFKSSTFDAETPIDKTLNFLSDFIGVGPVLF